jgi:hypothetical protein
LTLVKLGFDRGNAISPQLQAKRWILNFGDLHRGCCGLGRVSGLCVVRAIRPFAGCASRLAVIADNFLVRNGPGSTMVSLMPSGLSSACMASLKPPTTNFVAQ